jgi:putative restriction endonuclease
MSRETTLAAFSDLHPAKWKGEEARHKPLLVLFALSQWLQGRVTRFAFADVRAPLRDLIREFGFDGTPSADPRLPFWHLATRHPNTEPVWVVEAPGGVPIQYDGQRPSASDLEQQNAEGRFTDAVAADLYSTPGLVVELVGQLLCECFEPATHRALLQRLGLWLQ